MTENTALLNKIQAMLDRAKNCQAMGTEEGDAEAETAWVMAQKLMAKNQISKEMLRQQRQAKEGKTELKESDVYVADGPYRRSRAQLLSWLVGAMTGGAERRIASNGSFVRFFGYAEDRLVIQQMFEMIERQMVDSGKRRTARGEHKQEGMHAKTWLVQYFESYGYRVTERIRMARQEAAEEVVIAEGYVEQGETVGRVTGALVLATKSQTLNLAYKAKYLKKNKDGSPTKRKSSSWKAPQGQQYSWDAHAAGRTDGEKARINPNSELANRRALR
jgi:hypothetical protein